MQVTDDLSSLVCSTCAKILSNSASSASLMAETFMAMSMKAAEVALNIFLRFDYKRVGRVLLLYCSESRILASFSFNAISFEDCFDFRANQKL